MAIIHINQPNHFIMELETRFIDKVKILTSIISLFLHFLFLLATTNIIFAFSG